MRDRTADLMRAKHILKGLEVAWLLDFTVVAIERCRFWCGFSRSN